MKKLVNINGILLCVLFAFVITACSSDEEPQNSNVGMTIEKKDFVVSNSGENINIVISNVNSKPTFEISNNSKDWIQLYNWGGVQERNSLKYTFIFKISANEGYEQTRNGSITIKCGSESATISVSQSGSGPIIYLDENTIQIDSKGGEITPVVNSNFDYSVEILDVDWIKIVKQKSDRRAPSYFMTLNVEPNTGFEAREGKVRIFDKISNIADTLLIKQLQQDMIELDKTVINIDDTESTFDVSIHANVDYKLNIADSWITNVQSTETAASTKRYTFKVKSLTDAASRKGSITIESTTSSESIKYDIIVNQNSVLSLSFYSECMVETESKLLTVTNNTSQSLVWSSSNNSVATVDNNGNIKALKEGIASISVSTLDKKHTSICNLTVTPCLTFKSNPDVMIIGDQKLFEVINKSNQGLIWNSSKSSVASVDNNGLVNAKTNGTTTISVATEDGKYKLTHQLTVKKITDLVSINRTGIGTIVNNTGSYFTSTYTITNNSPYDITLNMLGTVSLNNDILSGNNSKEITLQSAYGYPSPDLVLKFTYNGNQYSVTSH